MNKRNILKTVAILLAAMLTLSFVSCAKDSATVNTAPAPAVKAELAAPKAAMTPAEINEKYTDSMIIQQLAMWQGEKMLTTVELAEFKPVVRVGAEDLAFGEVIQIMTALGKRELSAMTMQYIDAAYPWGLESDHPDAFRMAGAFGDDWLKASKEDRRMCCNKTVDLLHENRLDIYDKDPFVDFTEFLLEDRQSDSFLKYSRQRLERDLEFFYAQQQKSANK